jgi:hypothetical protein
MFVGRSVAVKVASLLLLVAPGAVLAQSAPVQSVDSRASVRSNRVLTKVVIYGSIGAIVGAIGSLRKRGGASSIDDENAGR